MSALSHRHFGQASSVSVTSSVMGKLLSSECTFDVSFGDLRNNITQCWTSQRKAFVTHQGTFNSFLCLSVQKLIADSICSQHHECILNRTNE